MAHCKDCTTEIPTGALVCTTCGAPVGLEASGSSSEGAKAMVEWLLRGMAGFVVVIVVAAAAFSAWSMATSLFGAR